MVIDMNSPDESFAQTSLAEGSGGLTTSTLSWLEEELSLTADSLSSTDSCRRMQELAYAEMAKRRRGLGHLTPEQERALEALLETLVARVSLMLSAAGAVYK